MFAQKFHMIKVCDPATLLREFSIRNESSPYSQSAHATRDPALCHVLATYQVTASCDVLRDGLSLAAQSWSFIGTSPVLVLHRYVTAAAGRVHGLLATAAASVCTALSVSHRCLQHVQHLCRTARACPGLAHALATAASCRILQVWTHLTGDAKSR